MSLGANVNHQAPLCMPAIIQSVYNYNPDKDLFKLLVKYRADINTRDSTQRTPMQVLLFSKKFAPKRYFNYAYYIEEDFLKKGADFNAIWHDENLIHTAIKHGVIEAIKPLSNWGTKINGKDKFQWTPLKWAINSCNFEGTKELCHLGVSLFHIDDNISNAFHVAIQRKLSKDYIKLFLINSRFDSYNKMIDKQLEKKVITAYLALEKSNIFPKEVQKIIVSYLALNYLYDFNKKFCQWLVKNGNENPLVAYTHTHVNYLEYILQSTNNQNKTALQVLHDEHQGDAYYIQEVESLVDVEKLRKDRIDFINGSVQDDNLAVQIYEHSKKLLLDRNF